MWGSFCLALLASLALLSVPGYFILRGLGFARLDSALAAPLPSVLLSALLAIVFYKCGLFCTWWLWRWRASLFPWRRIWREAFCRGQLSCLCAHGASG